MSYRSRGSEITSTCASCGSVNRVPASHLTSQGRCGQCGTAFGPMAAPLSVGSGAFDALIKQAKVPVLVDFWAGWCAPCRMAAPHVDETAKKMAGQAVVLKVDTEANPELAARYQVRGIPFFMVFRGGEAVFQQAGLVDASQMQAWLRTKA